MALLGLRTEKDTATIVSIIVIFLTIILLIVLFFKGFQRKNASYSDRERNRLKRQLTQNIAHELKTPVASLQGYLETIVNDPDMDEGTKRQFIERCYAQSTRLSNLMRDISLLTRLDEAAQSFDKEEVNLFELVEDVKNESSAALEQKGMSLLNMLSRNSVVNGNETLLYSIFRNLTDNSIAYAGNDAIIRVKLVAREEKFLTISFEDNGPGVPKEQLSHIFERFYRVDKGRSRKLGGTGLGLAIVKNAVLLHGGSVRATAADSGGLKVIFTLSEK